MTKKQPYALADQISKRFYGTQALDKVSIAFNAGEVHALVGENGAGKSTLMKILAGIQTPDSGEILIDDKPVEINSPRQATDLGIALIHQELNLCDNLSVAANIYLGREPQKLGLIDRTAIHEGAGLGGGNPDQGNESDGESGAQGNGG